MSEQCSQRTEELQRRMADDQLDAIVLSDPDSIYYFSGVWGYLGVEFGRPTIMVIPQQGDCTIITPLMESEMIARLTWVHDVRPWEDGIGAEWRGPLADLLGGFKSRRFAFERMLIAPLISEYLRVEFGDVDWCDAGKVYAPLRMIKSTAEIATLHQAAQEIYQSVGMSAGYRTGRNIGCSFIEQPQIAAGEKTRLQPGMALCIDAGITHAGRYGTRVGDSIVITETGYDFFTPYPKELRVI